MAVDINTLVAQAQTLSDAELMQFLARLFQSRPIPTVPTGIDPEKEAKGRARGFEPGDGLGGRSPEEQMRILHTSNFTRLDAKGWAELEQARREHHESV